jgi:hypothetical protein
MAAVSVDVAPESAKEVCCTFAYSISLDALCMKLAVAISRDQLMPVQEYLEAQGKVLRLQ